MGASEIHGPSPGRGRLTVARRPLLELWDLPSAARIPCQYPERPASLPRAVSFVRASSPQHRRLSFHGPPLCEPSPALPPPGSPPTPRVTHGEEGRETTGRPLPSWFLRVTTWLTRTEGARFADGWSRSFGSVQRAAQTQGRKCPSSCSPRSGGRFGSL